MALDRRSVSESTAARLSLYLRSLGILETEGAARVSSQTLARRFDLNSSQIRKDLATFGEFGVRGVGYEVPVLLRHLVSILGLDRVRRVAIVGAGRLGTALADDPGFGSGAFEIAAVFDEDPARIGTRTRSGVRVADATDLPAEVERLGIEIAVLTVPAHAAAAAGRLCWESGIQAILNFTPERLNPPPDVHVKNVDLRVNLETLAFYTVGERRAAAREDDDSSGEDVQQASFRDGQEPPGKNDGTSSGKDDYTSSVKDDLTSSVKDDLTSSVEDDYTSSGKDDCTSSGKDDDNSSGKEEPWPQSPSRSFHRRT